MRTLRDPGVRGGLYVLPDDPVARDVLIPGFRGATTVRGAFGWFSSGWVAALAPGLADYLNRDEADAIDFTVAPALFERDRRAIENVGTLSDEDAAALVADVFVNGRARATALARHALDCMAWMVREERLRLRIAIPTPESNYHPKMWLFEDGQDRVLARGSGNATLRGLTTGVEHLDVDVSWAPGGEEKVRTGVRILDDWSRGQSRGIRRVIPLPQALAQQIIQTVPDRKPTPTEYSLLQRRSRRRRRRRPSLPLPKLRIPEELIWKRGDYAHQGEAVRAWEGGKQPERGTISMATGAGKTITALICAARTQDRIGDGPFLIVVSAPSKPLISQWQQEVKRFGIRAIAPSLERSTTAAMTRVLTSVTRGGTTVLITTNASLCKPAFQSTVAHILARNGRIVPSLFIGDEAHTLGAAGFISNPPDFLEKRLALSATPVRQYDSDGTEKVFEFFGPPAFEFGLDKAIGFCLVPYDYHVHATTLTDDELARFLDLTASIKRMAMMADDEDAEAAEKLKRLLILRRRLVETAEGKLPLLKEVLERRGPRHIRHALIYSTAKDPAQFDAIGALLRDLGIRWAPVTQAETPDRRKLDRTFRLFADGEHQVLLAKKVLDEGVDIPHIREAFIVASSQVAREWIQRRGRVLRCHPGKTHATVHDFLALPSPGSQAAERDVLTLIQVELRRANHFARHARNAAGVRGVLEETDRLAAAYTKRWSAGAPLLSASKPHHISCSTPEGYLP